ncbi:MAG: BTAD domain-containing putative transcriptional regulator [Burkholderiales bacterium]
MSTRPNLRIAPAMAGSAAAHTSAPASAADGERLLAQHGLAGLRASLDAAAPQEAGWWHFWRGYAMQFDDLALAREQWLLAETCFEREGDTAGLDLAACGLIQCSMLDSLTYVGLDPRAARVTRAAAGGDPRTPLALFRVAARLLLTTELRQATDAVAGDIELAFAALGHDIEPEIALRVATAALPMLGLGLDRVRGEDFVQAGAAVAASRQVSDYSRALWHVGVVEARFYDASWSSRLRAELDAVDRLAPSDALRPLRARAHLLRAALALGEGDAATGRACLDAAHPLLNPSRPRDYWQFHYYCSRHALLTDEAEAAWEHAKVCHRKQIDAGVPEGGRTTIMMQEGYVLVALGRLDEAVATFARAGELSLGAQAIPCITHVHLTCALQHWRGGGHAEARAELTAAFTQARGIDLTHFFRALPNVAAELCGAAFELDADVAFAAKVVGLRRLECPDVGITRWPWPLRVRTLGGFVIERDGAPVKFARKAPKRLLDVLRLVTALGGRHVDAERVAATLWPDADGGEAHDALKAMLHRIRNLLGTDFLIVRDGQITFDDRVTWLDTWAFDHVVGRIESLLGSGAQTRHVNDGELEKRRLQLLSLYHGHLFGEAELPFWALPLRDRLRARFIRAIDALGQRLERTDRSDDAIALYRAALEHDNLAEELYQRLIACHLARGDSAQALNAYRRCRELLSLVLGLRPSTRTEALVARITQR